MEKSQEKLRKFLLSETGKLLNIARVEFKAKIPSGSLGSLILFGGKISQENQEKVEKVLNLIGYENYVG